MDTLTAILRKFDELDLSKNPVELPNVGRDTLATWFQELGFNKGAEIGVLSGQYSEVLFKVNPGLKLYGVDPWTPYKGYHDYTRGTTFNNAYRDMKERTKGLLFVEMKMFSADALKEFDDESLDFVYIDANHDYYNAVFDVYNWSKKVKKGGIISGHDYFRSQNKHNNVFDAINGYTRSYQISPWFVLGSNAEIPGQVRDEVRSWFWVKT